MNKLIKKLLLQVRILQLQILVKLLKKKLTIPNLDDPKHIVVHHGGGWLDFEGVNNYHKKKWGFKSSLGYYAGYHYFIERTGKVYQARRDNEEGAHCVDPKKPHYWNKNSIGICLMGNGVEKEFTSYQYLSLIDLLNQKSDQYNIPNSEIYGHCEIANTICPSPRAMVWLSGYTMGLVGKS